MLESLTVRNYALIEHVELSFGAHLNVLSGETGAGKSIIIGALGLLLGARATAADVRTGADRAEVTGVVHLQHRDGAVRAWLAERDFPVDDDSLIVRRVVRRSGRSGSFIGGVPVPTAQLGELGERLFDLHGQHRHQSLLREAEHRRLLDHFGGLVPLVERVRELHRQLAAARARVAELAAGGERRTRQAELLRHAADEIDAAGLRAGEEEELDQERLRLTAFERISEAAQRVYEATAEARGGALAAVRGALDDLRTLASYDAAFEPLGARAESAFYELEDVAEEVRRYRSGLYFDAARLAAVVERLEQIHSLQRKYGATVAAVLEHARQARSELAGLEDAAGAHAAAGGDVQRLAAGLSEQASDLSERRREAAARLRGLVEANLHELGMPKARFAVQLQPRQERGEPAIGPAGAEAVTFLVSANAGEPPRPLRSIASGGEVSRIMLALKSIFAASDPVGTLVFDEVDAGIGGAVAIAVGDKLAGIARRRQILCITHLATVAARAHTHLQVSKDEHDGRTLTAVKQVSGRARVVEVARMLSGDDAREVSLRHAEDLLTRQPAGS
ncbi:MAG: DNA repair protein RecN [Spirochaetaceae bacterium]|nr:DNA repair protein RecN [Spirochaetaceae bacterium]